MKRILLLALIGIGYLTAGAAATAGQASDRNYKFWVSFTDKKGSPYSILRPWDFLSDRAISRRNKAGYNVNIDDIPVVRKYISGVSESGVHVLLTSRWLNGVVLMTADSTAAARIAGLSYVKEVKLIGTYFRKRGAADWNSDNIPQSVEADMELEKIGVKNKVKAEEYNYGYGLGWGQISQIGGEKLHQSGYRGKGIYIAVFDAGFYRANRMEAFDSLFMSHRVLGTADMVDVGSEVYADDDHGTQVLSCLAANVPGVMIGTAPDASYFLIRTEDAGSETLAEEYQWLCGAEYADSLGVDIISSSLGYTEFDDSRMNHSFRDLNGYATAISIAANMAYDRGILVVNSAGNEGDESWKHIGAPADAAGVIAVGAVDASGSLADFSSRGPSSDNRVKPDMAAMGKRTVVVNSNGYFVRSNGTSYSAPVLAGSLACLLQAFYDRAPAEVRKLLLLSCNQYTHPDNDYGYGIPNLELAKSIATSNNAKATSEIPFLFWPKSGDTLSTGFLLRTTLLPSKEYRYSCKGDKKFAISAGPLMKLDFNFFSVDINPIKPGRYELEATDGVQVWKTSFYFDPQ